MGAGPLLVLRRGVVRAACAGAGFALAERHRWPLWLPVGLGTGIGIYFALPVEPSGALAWGVGLAGTGSAAAALASRWAGLRMVLGLAAALALGFALAKAREAEVAAPVLTRPMRAHVEGRIETVETRPAGVRLVLGDLLIPRVDDALKRVRVTLRKGTFAPGEWVQMSAMLMPPPASSEPHGYDFGRAAFFDGIGAVGFAYGRARPAQAWRTPDWRERTAEFVERLRWRMTARIQAVLPGSNGAIAAALITGERGGIAPDDEKSLRDAGLAHVLAIAGLHMALVGLGLFWMLRALLAAIPALALRYPIKKWAAGAALGGASFYLVISGAGTSATRAFIMLAMMLIAIPLDRPALSMRAIALAATIILVLWPESLIAPGFQMSFAAVASLIALAEWEQKRRLPDSPRGRFSFVWRYGRGIAVTSFVGSIATIPYSIFHFGRATHYAVLGNLLAMPIMGFVVMPAAAISVMAMPLGLEARPLHVMDWGITLMLRAGGWVSGLPGAVSPVAAWPTAALVVLSLGGLWILIWRGRWRWLGLLPLAGAVVFAMLARGPDLLVAGDAATVAIRSDSGRLGFVGGVSDGYAADEWLERDGDAGPRQSAPARCDGSGCVLRSKGRIIAISQRYEALADDCAKTAIVIAAFDVRDCKGPRLVIDRSSAMRDGGYAIRLSPLRVESVAEARGKRPWSQ